MTFQNLKERLCITRWLFGDRRKEDVAQRHERRGGPLRRSKAVSERLDYAADEICRTLKK